MPRKRVLVGIDPGIVDTGVVWVVIDIDNKTMTIQSKVWKNVTKSTGGGLAVSEKFLEELETLAYDIYETHRDINIFIEGYRNRGRNPQQDQKMTVLVQKIHNKLVGSTVVDNTDIKNVVTNKVLKLLDLYTWDIRTNHEDLRSAARIALKGAYKDLTLNMYVSEVVRAQLEEDAELSWTLTKLKGL